VASHVSGRHRAPGRYNPVSEISGIVAKSAQPAVKTTAVIAASGGLVASFALPASAATASHATEKATTIAAPAAVQAPQTAAPQAADSFGLIGFKATAKPKPAPAPAPVPVPVTRTAPVASRSVERVALTVAKPAVGGILGIAAQYQGVPYQYGGTTPAGFDCSGYTAYVFRQMGISLPRTASEQQAASTPVSNPQPGDLVFFGSPAYHVGIYAGNGMMWDSPHSGSSVGLRSIWSSSATYGRP
jgi:cell wall-associated NlpC family hydrolase